MKVGILTFHNVPNYGAVLQAFALQQTIQGLDYDCEIIDYENVYFERIYKPVLLKDLKYKKFFIQKVLLIPKTLSRKRKISSFVSEKLQLSNRKYKKEQLKDANKEYDCFITGSDQVWNLNVNGNDTSYFLDFVTDSKKKNSYAASYTLCDFSNEEEKVFRELLMPFNRISIRECEGVKGLEKLLKKDVSAVLDPTMLIDADFWNSMAQDVSSKPYILIYLMTPNSSIVDYAVSFAAERGLQVKYISLYDAFRKSGIDIISDASIEEWLGLIKNAEFVIANSFHGIAFSIIFSRNFMYAPIGDAGKNTRISSMLKTLKISGRELNLVNRERNFKPIDYAHVDQTLDRERKKSIAYLSDVFNENNK